MSVKITIEIKGDEVAAAKVQALRNALADRKPLHARMATDAKKFTQDYLRRLNRHATARRLGASPTGHLAKTAKGVQADSDAQEATVRIPRRTGIGRAFNTLNIRPKGGRKYLTIPASAETYGKGARDFDGQLEFVPYRTPALVWQKTGGQHKKGDVAYWLKREVTVKQDRTLLPSEEAYGQLGRESARQYLSEKLA